MAIYTSSLAHMALSDWINMWRSAVQSPNAQDQAGGRAEFGRAQVEMSIARAQPDGAYARRFDMMVEARRDGLAGFDDELATARAEQARLLSDQEGLVYSGDDQAAAARFEALKQAFTRLHDWGAAPADLVTAEGASLDSFDALETAISSVDTAINAGALAAKYADFLEHAAAGGLSGDKPLYQQVMEQTGLSETSELVRASMTDAEQNTIDWQMHIDLNRRGLLVLDQQEQKRRDWIETTTKIMDEVETDLRAYLPADVLASAPSGESKMDMAVHFRDAVRTIDWQSYTGAMPLDVQDGRASMQDHMSRFADQFVEVAGLISEATARLDEFMADANQRRPIMEQALADLQAGESSPGFPFRWPTEAVPETGELRRVAS